MKASRRHDKTCCACGAKAAPGVLVMRRATRLSAFPSLRPRRRFPLCSPCRRKIRWVEEEL